MYYVKPGQAFQLLCEINGDPSSLNIEWQMKTVRGNFADIPGKMLCCEQPIIHHNC